MAVTQGFDGLEYRLIHGAIRYTHAGRIRGHERFTISVNSRREMVHEHFGDGNPWRIVDHLLLLAAARRKNANQFALTIDQSPKSKSAAGSWDQYIAIDRMTDVCAL